MRVLCFSEKWESGGIESLLTSLYETMDLRDRDGAPLQVDIVACEYEPGIYDDRLAARGLSVRQLSGSTRDYRRNLAMFDELLRERRYDVAHLNLYEGLALLFARHARRAGVGRVIVHSHNAGLRPSSLRSLKMALHRASVRVLADDADLRWAPSQAAARFLFGDRPWTLVPNGIRLGDFAFSAARRVETRRRLGLAEGDFAMGCVGRLVAQKNQAFLIDLLARSRAGDDGVTLPSHARLVLVGQGDDKARLRERARARGVQDVVTFTGASDDVANLYQAMDVLCMPSLFEGLGIVAVEAQASGLPVVCSRAIPPEAQATSLLSYADVEPVSWAAAVRAARGVVRADATEQLRRAGYDLADMAAFVRGAYLGETSRRITVPATPAHAASALTEPAPAMPPAAAQTAQATPAAAPATMSAAPVPDMTSVLVSVIIPVYRVEPYLRACVDGVRTQTHEELDIILVDDGSPDACPSICDEYAAADARVRVIHQANKGLSAARNAGLAIACGAFVSFVDSDDVVAPAFVETLLDACGRTGAVVAQCGFTSDQACLGHPPFDRRCPSTSETASTASGAASARAEMASRDEVTCGDDVPRFAVLTAREASRRLVQDGSGAFTVVWNKLYRRELLEGVQFPAGRQHEDEFVTYRLLWEAVSIAVTDDALYFYRQRPTSTMGVGFSRRSLDAIEALGERLTFYRAHDALELVTLTRAQRCHRLRAMAAHFDELPVEQAERLRSLMREDYRAVMSSRGQGAASIGKRLALTLQMVSPALHDWLAGR
ncbi:glycosyltransferase [bacterium]|nr:glycosyltransferase [bacterium]